MKGDSFMNIEEGIYDANYIAADTLPFFPVPMNGTEIKLLRVNPISGQFILVQKSKPNATINIHKHYGAVIGYTQQGAWGYKEYNWVAKKGDFVFEPAGSTHTLYTEPGDEETIIFFVIDGAMEFLDENGNTLAMFDWKMAFDLYQNYCKENNLEIIDLTKFE